MKREVTGVSETTPYPQPSPVSHPESSIMFQDKIFNSGLALFTVVVRIEPFATAPPGLLHD